MYGTKLILHRVILYIALLVVAALPAFATTTSCDTQTDNAGVWQWDIIALVHSQISRLRSITESIVSAMKESAPIYKDALEFLLAELPSVESPPEDAIDLFAINLATGEVAYQTPRFDSQLVIRPYDCEHLPTIVSHVDHIQRNPSKYQGIADGMASGSVEGVPWPELAWLTHAEGVDVGLIRSVLGHFAEILGEARRLGNLAEVLDEEEYTNALSLLVGMRYDAHRTANDGGPGFGVWTALAKNPDVSAEEWGEFRGSAQFDEKLWDEFQALPEFREDWWGLIDQGVPFDVLDKVIVRPADLLGLLGAEIALAEEFAVELEQREARDGTYRVWLPQEAWGVIRSGARDGRIAAERLDMAADRLVAEIGFVRWSGQQSTFNKWAGDADNDLAAWAANEAVDLGTFAAFSKAYLAGAKETITAYSALFGDREYVVPTRVWNGFQSSGWEYARSIGTKAGQVDGLTTMGIMGLD